MEEVQKKADEKLNKELEERRRMENDKKIMKDREAEARRNEIQARVL